MSNMMSVWALLRTNPGTTLPLVIQALREALAKHAIDANLEIEGDAQIPQFGEASLVDRDDWIHLNDKGTLSLRLTTSGTGHGIAPSLLDPLVEALSPLCTDEGGFIEYVDEESSPSNDSAVCAVFIGPTEQARRTAQVVYGLDKAREWLAPVLPETALDEISRLALESALEPSSERPAHSRLTP